MSNKKRRLDNDTKKKVKIIESSDENSDFCEIEDDESEYSISDDIDYVKNALNKLPKKGNKKLFTNYDMVLKELEKTEPNIKSLLGLPLKIEDRTKLYQLYNIYRNHNPNTVEWLEARETYNTKLEEFKNNYKQYKKFSRSEHSNFSNFEKNVVDCDNNLELKYKIMSLNTSLSNKNLIYSKYRNFVELDSNDDEYSKLKQWLKWATEIPHDTLKEIRVPDITNFIKIAREKLDQELFGMETIKEQILLFLSSKILNPNMVKTNLGLIGPPGVGKTAIAKLLSELLDWGFEQISFGGISKGDFLKGHDYTYVGSQPGEIVKCLKRLGSKNGIIFFDELDKACDNNEISSSLLHIIDKSQNRDFRDNFLSGISIDLSNIWFIASMNKVPQDIALVDRWWIINVDGYNMSDKILILTNYLLPKTLKNNNMELDSVSFSSKSVVYFIERVTNLNDRGVRIIEKFLEDIINKISFILNHQDDTGNLPFNISFNLKKKIVIPLILSEEIINILIKIKPDNYDCEHMYI